MQWKIVYAHHKEALNMPFCTVSELENAGLDVMHATVPKYFGLKIPICAVRSRSTS